MTARDEVTGRDGSTPHVAVQDRMTTQEGVGGMAEREDEDTRTYAVVVNDEEQYSVWPADRDVPEGWRAEGVTGTKDACLAHIAEVWTDMRPLSLRRKMSQGVA